MYVQVDFIQQQPRKEGLQFYVIGRIEPATKFSAEVYIGEDCNGVNRVTDVQMRSGPAMEVDPLWIDFCEQLAQEVSCKQPQKITFYDHWATTP